MSDMHELDEFDLDELRAIAPVDLSKAAPEWEMTRERIVHDLVGEPAPTRTSWLPRLAVAAAAVLAIGGGAVMVDRSASSLVPAGPASVSSTAPGTHQQGQLDALREIPAGKYLSQGYEVRTTGDTAGLKGPANFTRTDFFGADGSAGAVVDGQRIDLGEATHLGLEGAPSDTTALGQFLLAAHGATASPQSSATPGSYSPNYEQAQLGNQVVELLRDPRTSKQFREALLQVAEQNPTMGVIRDAAGTTVTFQATVQDAATRAKVVLDPVSLESRRVEVSRSEVGAGQNRVTTITEVRQPVQILDSRP